MWGDYLTCDERERESQSREEKFHAESECILLGLFFSKEFLEPVYICLHNRIHLDILDTFAQMKLASLSQLTGVKMTIHETFLS